MLFVIQEGRTQSYERKDLVLPHRSRWCLSTSGWALGVFSQMCPGALGGSLGKPLSVYKDSGWKQVWSELAKRPGYELGRLGLCLGCPTGRKATSWTPVEGTAGLVREVLPLQVRKGA